jgi:hypothetical protein
MSPNEIADLFSKLEYDDDHAFAHCQYGEKRNWFGWGSKAIAEESQ